MEKTEGERRPKAKIPDRQVKGDVHDYRKKSS